MDHIDLQAFIRAQKNILVEYEEEYNVVAKLESDLQKNKPIKWYNNSYYIAKRVLLILLSIVFAILVVSLFLFRDEFKELFNQYLSVEVLKYIDKFSSTQLTSMVELKSVLFEAKNETEAIIHLNNKIQLQLADKIFDSLRIVSAVILSIGIILLLYISRLTKIMHKKNKVIEAYYQSSKDLAEVYKVFIENKKDEIKFLSHFSK
jgi:hypothetical protein